MRKVLESEMSEDEMMWRIILPMVFPITGCFVAMSEQVLRENARRADTAVPRYGKSSHQLTRQARLPLVHKRE